ncbi:hypothetical protein BC835DRAFT_1425053 [Cytidiella melzeri]|nr:hypothetical protein BC835DRAFT_1425053 [Cytidiella melzeri]
MEHQDAVQRFDQYLQWLKAGCKSQLPSCSGYNHTEEAEDAEKDGEEVEKVEQETAPESHVQADNDSEEYNISKRPAFPSMSVETITEEFSAPDFICCLEEFVTKTVASSSASPAQPTNTGCLGRELLPPCGQHVHHVFSLQTVQKAAPTYEPGVKNTCLGLNSRNTCKVRGRSSTGDSTSIFDHYCT